MGSYDFVIAGGGTAGLVLAARLSEDPSQSVVVLEAGSDHSEDFQVKTPAFYAALFGTDVDWNFASEAQVRTALEEISIASKLISVLLTVKSIGEGCQLEPRPRPRRLKHSECPSLGSAFKGNH